MTKEMQMMLKECIEKDLSFEELSSILKPLSWIWNDRMNKNHFIRKRFLEDRREVRKMYDERIKRFEDEEIEDKQDASEMLKKTGLNFDVDELLGI